MPITYIQYIHTSTLNICYEENGPTDHFPIILLHGFPDDVRVWDNTIPELVKNGFRTITPYLRGFGKTRFLSSSTLRSGQQAVLGNDLLELMNCLNIQKAILVGYDWGGRAACIVSALWPERVTGLISIGGYNIQNISKLQELANPEKDYKFWYQWYFHTARGRTSLELNRRKLCRLLWKLWSPNLNINDKEFEYTAVSFDNPDFVDVVIHSYQHRYGLVAGDPSVEFIERKLANQPLIQIPTIEITGASDGLNMPEEITTDHSQFFTKYHGNRLIPLAGHFLPRESPAAVVQAILDLWKIVHF